jgi:hypothetical protein
MSWFSCFDWSCFEDSARPVSSHARIAVHRIDRIGDTPEIHFLESKLKDFIRCPDVHAKFGDTLQRKSKHTMVLRSQAGRDNPFEVDHIFECQCASHAILQTPEWSSLWSSNSGILAALRETADGHGGRAQPVGRAFERFPVLAKTAREIYSIHNNLGANGAPLDDAFNMSMLQQSLNATKGSAFKSFLESRWGSVDGGPASAFEGLRHHFRHSSARRVHGILVDDDEADALAKAIHEQLQRQVRDPYIDAVNAVAERYSRPEAAMFSGLADTLEQMFDEFEQVSLEHD